MVTGEHLVDPARIPERYITVLELIEDSIVLGESIGALAVPPGLSAFDLVIKTTVIRKRRIPSSLFGLLEETSEV